MTGLVERRVDRQVIADFGWLGKRREVVTPAVNDTLSIPAFSLDVRFEPGFYGESKLQLNKNLALGCLGGLLGVIAGICLLLAVFLFVNRISDAPTPKETHQRISNGDTEWVRKHLHRINVGERFPYRISSKQYTPIHLACMEAQPKVLKILLTGGVSVTLADVNGESPLSYCIGYNDSPEALKCLQILIDAGATVTSVDMIGYAPLHRACEFNDLESAKVLLKARYVDANQPGPSWRTPLHIAVLEKDINHEIVRQLLKAGADPLKTDQSGKTPIDYAEERGDFYLVGIFQDAIDGR